MRDETKYLFAGNRLGVLHHLLSRRSPLAGIFAVSGCRLESALRADGIAFTPLESKAQLCEAISEVEFDVFVSNGCPYILPVSALKRPHQAFVNVHPSCLPDLKGANPVNGAMLFNRPAGASCHLMDDRVDTGPIIARIEIPLTPDLDLGLLYQLSFLAESEVFAAALHRDFTPDSDLALPSAAPIYYTRKEADRLIDFTEDKSSLIRRVNAFGISTQQAWFEFKAQRFYVLAAQEVSNPYLLNRVKSYKDLEIAFGYESTVILRKDDGFIKLCHISGNLNELRPGTVLSGTCD